MVSPLLAGRLSKVSIRSTALRWRARRPHMHFLVHPLDAAHRKDVGRTSNLIRCSAGSSQATCTSDTYAPGGPPWHQRTISSTLAPGPSKTPSTPPESRLRPHPHNLPARPSLPAQL